MNPTLTPPSFLESLDTDDKDVLGNDSNFPDAVILIGVGGGRYAAVNCTTDGPDPMTVALLVCFATEKEAEIWEAIYFDGEKVNKEFQEARDIALSKSNIYGLALQEAGVTKHIHWVK